MQILLVSDKSKEQFCFTICFINEHQNVKAKKNVTLERYVQQAACDMLK